MVNFMEDNADSEIYSNELKKQAGFGKDGERGFDGAITNLMMQTYLCNCDFKICMRCIRRRLISR